MLTHGVTGMHKKGILFIVICQAQFIGNIWLGNGNGIEASTPDVEKNKEKSKEKALFCLGLPDVSDCFAPKRLNNAIF